MSVLLKIISERTSFLMTLALAFCALLLVFLFGVGVLEYLNWRGANVFNVKLQFNAQGATIWMLNDERKKATFLLPASSGWTNTGIEVPPDAMVKIVASGRVHLAAEHLIHAAREDVRPSFEWAGPDGVDSVSPRPRDIARAPMTIMPGNRLGALIGVFDSGQTVPPSNTGQPRPNGMFLIGGGGEKRNQLGKAAVLWLSVNDILLDAKNQAASEMAYIGSPVDGFMGLKGGSGQFENLRVGSRSRVDYEKDRKKHQDHFRNYIAPTQYWDLWLADNLGEFLVQIEVVPREE